MLALISPAKTMQSRSTSDALTINTEPRFMEHTNHIVSIMSQYSALELAEIFRVSTPIAKELRSRFQVLYLDADPKITAIDSYDGIVYKHFKETLDAEYLQNRVRISSLLYGLLRPFDMIRPYRMEGFVRIAGSDERVDNFWRDIQTQTLIDDVNEMGGTLLYLASKEEQKAFNWREVLNSVKVIDFRFLQQRGDKLKQVVIYTKMARGEMIRYMVEHKITTPDSLKEFEWCGYIYNDALSTDNIWVWVME